MKNNNVNPLRIKRKGGSHPFLSLWRRLFYLVCICAMVYNFVQLSLHLINDYQNDLMLKRLQTQIRNESNLISLPLLSSIVLPISDIPLQRRWLSKKIPVLDDFAAQPVITSKYQSIYEQNQDFVGWLKIDDTNIDYPVVQTPHDEDYYLYRDFNKKWNRNGTLIMDTDSVVGVGSDSRNYQNGFRPSTNLIIHGHAMFSGNMFGKLHLFENETYGKNHARIGFHTLYETRQYELIAVFYSQVYYKNQNVFKYYNFFQANNEDEFNDWLENITKLSIYDTGLTSEYGDEFITLSTCSYDRKDGRLVVIGKRVS